jgi:hypothetical protein
VVTHTSIISAVWGAEIGGSWSKANPRQTLGTLSEKQTKSKAAGVANR